MHIGLRGPQQLPTGEPHGGSRRGPVDAGGYFHQHHRLAEFLLRRGAVEIACARRRLQLFVSANGAFELTFLLRIDLRDEVDLRLVRILADERALLCGGVG
jgi:hypothetical protein